jgi:hypothetical protein
LKEKKKFKQIRIEMNQIFLPEYPFSYKLLLLNFFQEQQQQQQQLQQQLEQQQQQQHELIDFKVLYKSKKSFWLFMFQVT